LIVGLHRNVPLASHGRPFDCPRWTRIGALILAAGNTLRDLRAAGAAGFAPETTTAAIDQLLLDFCEYVRRPEPAEGI
jgi:hypothetical protein